MPAPMTPASPDAPPLHAASVGVFLRYLDRLDHQLGVAEAHVIAAGKLPEAVLQARLAPDMLPLAAQVRTAAHFSLRTAWPMSGRPVPQAFDSPESFAGLREAVRDAMARLQALPVQDFADPVARHRVLESQAGSAWVRLPAPAFLHEYALPNFFFHLGMAYALMRHQGVPLGKADFDGWHAYPALR